MAWPSSVATSDLITAAYINSVKDAIATWGGDVDSNGNALSILRAGIGTTPTQGLALRNLTDAAAGAQQYSPFFELEGQGWKTDATAASQSVKWRAQIVPVQGAAAPSARLDWEYKIGAGDYTNALSLLNGNVGIGTTGPEEKLQVAGGGVFVTGSKDSITVPISWADHSPVVKNGLSFSYDATNHKSRITSLQETTAWNPLYFQGSEYRFVTGTTGALTERMTMLSSGYMGIGDTNPPVTLSLKQDHNDYAMLYLQNTNVAGFSSIDFKDNSGTTQGSMGWANANVINDYPNTFNLGSFNANPFILYTNFAGVGATAAEKMRISATGGVSVGNGTWNVTDPGAGNVSIQGNVGIGTTDPTAILHLKAGTAAAGTAPLKFLSGPKLTSPEDGAWDYDGTHLYFTIGAARFTVDLTAE